MILAKTTTRPKIDSLDLHWKNLHCLFEAGSEGANGGKIIFVAVNSNLIVLGGYRGEKNTTLLEAFPPIGQKILSLVLLFSIDSNCLACITNARICVMMNKQLLHGDKNKLGVSASPIYRRGTIGHLRHD